MRFAVLGAGLQGSACAFDLLSREEVDHVLLLDRQIEELPGLLEGRTDEKLEVGTLDFEDEEAVAEAIRGCHVALSAAPFYLNYELARIAVAEGLHYADLGGNTDVVFRQMELDEEAKAKELSVIPDVGLAPGMVNILAAQGIGQLDEIDSVKVYVGGLPQEPRPPLNYEVVYSLEGALDYYTTPSWILREGKRVQMEALAEVELLDFPELGQLEAFHTSGGISTLPWKYEGVVEEMEYKTLRYPGHAHIMRAIRDLGLLDVNPVPVDGQSVVPREVFISVVSPLLKREESRDVVLMREIVEGTREGEPVRLRWELIDRYDKKQGISAMARSTAFSLSIVGLMQGRGLLTKGVATPDESVPAEPYIEALAERGIEIEFSEESGENVEFEA